MKIMSFVMLAFFLIMIGLARTSNPGQANGIGDSSGNCAVMQELKYCAALTVVTSEYGYKIVLDTSLKNIGGKTVKIPAGDFYGLHNFTITGPAGDRLLSKREAAEKDLIENGDAKKAIESLPIRLPKEDFVDLGPNEEVKKQFNLCDYYKFESKGVYIIDISRKVALDKANLLEIKLPSINVEIK